MSDNQSKTCGNCKHFSALANECRMKAPAVFFVMTPDGPQGFSMYPAVSKDNGWCGEFAPDIIH
jgi:hypothetical protein